MKFNVNFQNKKVVAFLSNLIGGFRFNEDELEEGIRNLRIESVSISLFELSMHLSWDARDIEDFTWDEDEGQLPVYSDWYHDACDIAVSATSSCGLVSYWTR